MDSGSDDITAPIAQAIGRNDKDALIALGGELLRRGLYSSASRLLSLGGLAGKRWPLPEWGGEPVAGKRALVLRRTGHVGAVIRMSQLAAHLAGRGATCVTVVEPRLVELLSRSFPDVTYVTERPPFEGFDVCASYETLAQHFFTDEGEGPHFLPLRANPARVQALRTRYFAGKPLVGISWHSTNDRKDLPSPAAWAAALSGLDATYVSLQYGEAMGWIAALKDAGGPSILHDASIDALNDIDALSAQIMALDAVLTVSNTTAHLAGALGQRVAVALDGKPHLVWPYQGDRTPWYPSLRLTRPSPDQSALTQALRLVRDWVTASV